MSPLDKTKTIKKMTETVAASPIAGRTRMSSATNTAPTLQEIMEGLQTFLTPQFATLKTDVVASVTASVNDRLMDLENNLDQIKTTMDTQQQALQDELSQVIKRLEAVEQENAVLRGAPTSSTKPTTSTTSPSQLALGTAASKYATTSTQDSVTTDYTQRSRQPASTEEPYYGGLRYFTPVSNNQGFQHLYLPSRGRRSYREIRELLDKKVHMDRGAVIDMHYPSSSVIALLVHNDYADTAIQLLRAKKLTPIEDFNPYDHRNLGDKEYANASVEVREAKMKEVVDHQPYVTIGFIKKPAVKLAVARDFHRKGKITSDFLQELVQLHGTPRSSTKDSHDQQQHPADHDMLEDQEDEFMDHHSMNSEVDNNTTLERQTSTGNGEPLAAL